MSETRGRYKVVRRAKPRRQLTQYEHETRIREAVEAARREGVYATVSSTALSVSVRTRRIEKKES